MYRNHDDEPGRIMILGVGTNADRVLILRLLSHELSYQSTHLCKRHGAVSDAAERLIGVDILFSQCCAARHYYHYFPSDLCCLVRKDGLEPSPQ